MGCYTREHLPECAKLNVCGEKCPVAYPRAIDEKWLSGRNVRDDLKSLSTEEIKDKLYKNSFPYATCFEQWSGDFNFSSGVRNSNAFAAREVYYIGKKQWDRRGAVGTQNYIDVKYLTSYEELLALKDKYVFVGMDNVDGSVPMETFSWPDNALIIFGEENAGITKEVLQMCDAVVAISQYGSVRSLNAAVASGIAMFDYTNKKR